METKWEFAIEAIFGVETAITFAPCDGKAFQGNRSTCYEDWRALERYFMSIFSQDKTSEAGAIDMFIRVPLAASTSPTSAKIRM
jgi:hypothetical protein